MLYYLFTTTMSFYQVKMLMSHVVQTTNLTIVGKEMRYTINSGSIAYFQIVNATIYSI